LVSEKGTATEDAICNITNEILNALNNKIMAGNIFAIWRKLSSLLIKI